MEKNLEVRNDYENELSARDRPGFFPVEDIMDQYFGNPFGRILGEWPTMPRETAARVEETDQGYLLSLDVPGVPMNEIDINVSGNVLTIKAEHSENEDDGKKGYRRQYRKFQQSFSLPSTVQADQIEAHCENGILELAIPKAAEATAKKIKIQSGKGTLRGGFAPKGKKDGRSADLAKH